MLLITEYRDDISISEQVLDEKSGKKNWFIEGVFMQSEVKNRNKRSYPHRILAREAARYKKEYVDTGRAIGELNHPNSPQVNPERASHLITSISEQGNDFLGKAKVLNTPMGNIVGGLLEGNVRIGVSTRGMGSISEGIIQDDYRLGCVDIVADPSAPDAFVNGLMEGVEWIWENGILTQQTLESAKKDINKAYAKPKTDESQLILTFESLLSKF